MSNADIYFAVDGDTLSVELWYPRSDNRPKHVEVGLLDVRAADEIRISYDFDRDGWKIEQQQRFRFPEEDKERDPMWKEVAFVQAWGSEDEAWEAQFK